MSTSTPPTVPKPKTFLKIAIGVVVMAGTFFAVFMFYFCALWEYGTLGMASRPE